VTLTDAINDERLRALPGPSHVFVARDGGDEPELGHVSKLSPLPPVLELRAGAQVCGSRVIVTATQDLGFGHR
jgi:hypothetical protein